MPLSKVPGPTTNQGQPQPLFSAPTIPANTVNTEQRHLSRRRIVTPRHQATEQPEPKVSPALHANDAAVLTDIPADVDYSAIPTESIPGMEKIENYAQEFRDASFAAMRAWTAPKSNLLPGHSHSPNPFLAARPRINDPGAPILAPGKVTPSQRTTEINSKAPSVASTAQKYFNAYTDMAPEEKAVYEAPTQSQPYTDPRHQPVQETTPAVAYPPQPPVQGYVESNDPKLAAPVEPEEDKPEFTDDELLAVLDSVLNAGYALDSFKIRDTAIVLKSRFSWEDLKAVKQAEMASMGSSLGANLSLSYAMLAGSIVRFGDNVFQVINEGTTEQLDNSYKERYNFVTSLPGMLAELLIQKESKLNRKLASVVKDFDRLITLF